MNISARDRGLLAGVAAIAAAAAFFVLVIIPQHHQAAALQRSIAATQTKLSAAQSAYASGRAAQKRLVLIADEYAAAHRAVPEYANIPALLRLLQRTSAAAHVQMSSISVGGSSTSGTATPPTTATTATPAGSASAPTAVPVALSFNGGYAALKRLVHRLDALVVVSHGRLTAAGPLVGVSNIALGGAQAGGSGSASSPLSVTLTATIYQNGSSTSESGGS